MNRTAHSSIAVPSRPEASQSFFQDENGATAIEYGLIAALICVVVISGMYAVRAEMITLYQNIGNNIGGNLGSN